MSTRIFISHRPEDSGAAVYWLDDRLAEAFGRDNVLMNLEGAPAGAELHAQLPENVATQVAEQVSRCSVLIAVIGPLWLGARDAAGSPRIGRRNDLVTAAITAATARNIRVILVFIDGATMPPAGALPDCLLSLAWREAVVIQNLQADADWLVEILRGAAPQRSRLFSLPHGRSVLDFLRRFSLPQSPTMRKLALPNLSLSELSLPELSLPKLSLDHLAAFATAALATVAARVRAVPRRKVVVLSAGALLVVVAAVLTDRLATGTPPVANPNPWEVPAGFSTADFRIADRISDCEDDAPPDPVPINVGGAANLGLLKQTKAFASSVVAPGRGRQHQTAYLIDGWYGSCQSWVPAAMPAWVEVDLGEIFRVKGVRLGSEHRFRSDRAPTAFSIATRVDQSQNWNVIYEQPATARPLQQTMEFLFSSSRPAQYVRVDITATRDGDLPRLDEFEIYGRRR